MAWKITFHLPSEAIKHERKFPKEVRYLSLPISADSLDAQCSGMIQVGGPHEGRERKRPEKVVYRISSVIEVGNSCLSGFS